MKIDLNKIKNLISPKQFGENVFLSILSNLKGQRPGTNPIKLFASALENLSPGITIRSRIKSGRLIYFPAKLNANTANFVTLKWLLTSAKTYVRTKKSLLSKNITLEIIDILNNTGKTIKEKQNFCKSIKQARINVVRYHNKINQNLKQNDKQDLKQNDKQDLKQNDKQDLKQNDKQDLKQNDMFKQDLKQVTQEKIKNQFLLRLQKEDFNPDLEQDLEQDKNKAYEKEKEIIKKHDTKNNRDI